MYLKLIIGMAAMLAAGTAAAGAAVCKSIKNKESQLKDKPGEKQPDNINECIDKIYEKEGKYMDNNYMGFDDDDFYIEPDDSDEDEEYDDEIDNTDLNYENNNICIILNNTNNKQNRLKMSEKILCRKYPKFKEINSEERLQTILEGVFPEGFLKQMYVRNLSFVSQNGYNVNILGIRPERMPGDFLEQYIPENVSLIFKGHLIGKEFMVDSVHETSDTPQLDFEVNVSATPYRSPENIYSNFLYDVQENSDSITEHTEEKLGEWKDYLDWKKELLKRQIYGCKYFRISYDDKKKHLVFWLVFDSEEHFRSFRKHLSKKDIQAFDNGYSKDMWHFEFSDDSDKKYQRFNSVKLGQYQGILKQYYLRDVIDFSEIRDMDNEEDDENDEESMNIESALISNYDNPYIVQVAYEFNDHDTEEMKDLEDEEKDQYVYENVLGSYFNDGFLALSAVGQFVLINRFSKAITQLERDDCVSPNLALWLFNIKRARTPDSIDTNIDKWLNPRIEKNEDQKMAVCKMLAAPDICLIQGPPGTGKTTVIAEAIYQFIRKGNRVLIVSQSNDAVDNALERLVDTPEIRAIRLGQKGGKSGKSKGKIRSDAFKFSEDKALEYYYNALSVQLSKTWLDMWDSLESGGRQYDIDIRDAGMFSQDIAELTAELNGLSEKYNSKIQEYRKINEEIEQANNFNIQLENSRFQYNMATRLFNGDSDEDFHFTEDMLRCFEKNIIPLAEKTRDYGIYLIPDVSAAGADEENAYFVLLAKNMTTIRNLIARMAETEKTESSRSGDAILLESRITEIKQKMSDYYLNDENEKADEYKKEYKALLKKRDELKFRTSLTEITDMEKNIIKKELLDDIASGNSRNIQTELQSIMSEWENAIEAALRDVEAYLAESEPYDVASIIRRKEAAEAECSFLKEQMQSIKEQRAVKSHTLIDLRNKYNIESTNVDEIIQHIKELKEENIRKLEEQKNFRNDWEKTIRAFKSRLDDKSSFIYDQEHYQQIYMNACNVVGISCTDDMRSLTDRYDDFDVVIIDEVSKATPPEMLIPLRMARKAVLVGDHRQLPPMFDEHEASYDELINDEENIPEEVREILTSDNFRKYKKMVTASLFKEYFEQADPSIKHSLLSQYRMHSDIMNIINRFYENRLRCGLSEAVEKLEKNHGLLIKGVDKSTFITPDRHAYWIDSSSTPGGKHIYESFINKSTSACNIYEKHLIMELLKKIAAFYKEQGYGKGNVKTIGIISFYQMQVNILRKAFNAEKAKNKFDFSSISVDINTVDRFQGKEKNIIIASLVRNNRSGNISQHVIAFERINVAFSRAQELLFIVGAKDIYEKSEVKLPRMDMPGFRTTPVYKNIINDLYRQGCFKTGNKLITPETEEIILQEYKENGGKL